MGMAWGGDEDDEGTAARAIGDGVLSLETMNGLCCWGVRRTTSFPRPTSHHHPPPLLLLLLLLQAVRLPPAFTRSATMSDRFFPLASATRDVPFAATLASTPPLRRVSTAAAWPFSTATWRGGIPSISFARQFASLSS